MRKLASIQKILNVRPIDGADRIEVVDVLGWSVVVQKGDFAVGDLCVYFEIDSFIPEAHKCMQTEVFEPRMITWNTKRGMRLKTIKLRKQISQGLVLRIDNFEELQAIDPLYEGTDVTEILKVEKWEPAEEASGNNGGINKTSGAGKFPSFLRKTDQERVQNYLNELEKYKADTFEVTIKLDGSSMTLYHVTDSSPHYAHIVYDIESRVLRKKGFFGKLFYSAKKKLGLVKHPQSFSGVCSRNIELDIEDDNHFSTFARVNGLLRSLKHLGLNIAVQGELIAPTIQENHERVDSFEFYVYDVFDIDAQMYYLPHKARGITAALGFKYVPVLDKAYKLPEGSPREVVDALLQYAEGPGMNEGVKREGIVLKSNQRDFSMKAISNSYLLKKEGK